MTLVGEKERKLLKEVVKKAITPLKTRIVPQGRTFSVFITPGPKVIKFSMPNSI